MQAIDSDRLLLTQSSRSFLHCLASESRQTNYGSRLKKIRIEMTVRAPRSLVSSSYLDPALFKERQEKFERYEVLEGAAGQPGAKYRIVSSVMKGEIEHTESLDSVSLPEKVVISFAASHGSGTTINEFEEIDDASTRWIQRTEFEADAMPLIGRLFIKSIMKATAQREMERFRKYVELTAGSL